MLNRKFSVNKSFSILFLFGLTLMNFVLRSSSLSWNYLQVNGEFPKWGGFCDNGSLQSPIDLSIGKSQIRGNGKLNFENYDIPQKEAYVANTGNSLIVNKFSTRMVLSGGLLSGDYILDKISFHWLSEHTINNVRYPLECQIVHRKSNYPTMEEAVKNIDGIVVIAVLYHFATISNEGLEKLQPHIKEVKNFKNLNRTVIIRNFTVRELFPYFRSYFTYFGSTTVPGCEESVQWIVLYETVPIIIKQMFSFNKLEYDEDKRIIQNFRETQNRNKRPITYVMYDPPNLFAEKNSGELNKLRSRIMLGTIIHFLIVR